MPLVSGAAVSSGLGANWSVLQAAKARVRAGTMSALRRAPRRASLNKKVIRGHPVQLRVEYGIAQFEGPTPAGPARRLLAVVLMRRDEAGVRWRGPGHVCQVSGWGGGGWCAVGG